MATEMGRRACEIAPGDMRCNTAVCHYLLCLDDVLLYSRGSLDQCQAMLQDVKHLDLCTLDHIRGGPFVHCLAGLTAWREKGRVRARLHTPLPPCALDTVVFVLEIGSGCRASVPSRNRAGERDGG